MPIKPENKKLYPPNWKEISERIRFERAENHCEQCMVPNRALVWRGMCNDMQVWQDDDGVIYSAIDGKRIGDNYVGDLDGKVTCVKIVLTVGHVDHDPTNNEEDNLKAWCQRCHNVHDAPHRRETRKQTKLKTQPQLF